MKNRIVTHNGVFKFEGTENTCFEYILKHQPQSVDWACKYEGWKVTPKSTWQKDISSKYVIDCINSEPYDIECNTIEEKLQFLWDTFTSEYSYLVERKGAYLALQEYIMGIPSIFNIDYSNYDILERAKEWKSIDNNASEKLEDKIIANWTNYIANRTFQLFRKYKVS